MYLVMWALIILLLACVLVYTPSFSKPYSNKHIVNRRVKALYSGKTLLKFSAISLVFQIFYFVIALKNNFFGAPQWLIICITTFSSGSIIFYSFSGTLRILIFCYRLNIVKRIIVIFLLFIPIVNIFALRFICTGLQTLNGFSAHKAACQNQRAENQVYDQIPRF